MFSLIYLVIVFVPVLFPSSMLSVLCLCRIVLYARDYYRVSYAFACDHKSTELLGEHSSTDELVPKLRRFPLFLPLDDKTGPVLRELVRQRKAERGYETADTI